MASKKSESRAEGRSQSERRGGGSTTPPQAGGILKSLRRSPLVGAELDLTCAVTPGRKVDL